MPSAATHPATTTGHGGWPPTVSTLGSSNVFIGGKPAVMGGIPFVVHTNPSPSSHMPNSQEGSGSVNINGKPACRVGDKTDCGDMIVNGVGTVIIGN